MTCAALPSGARLPDGCHRRAAQRHAPTHPSRSRSPSRAQTVVTILKYADGGKYNNAITVPQMPVKAAPPPAPAPVPVTAPAGTHLRGADQPNAPPPLAANTASMQVKFYEGNAVTVFSHPDLGQGGANWWPSVEHGWEKDSLQAIRTLLTRT